jgi:hypothetical protein
VGKQGGTKGGRLQGEVIAATADASVVAARWWREMDGGRWLCTPSGRSRSDMVSDARPHGWDAAYRVERTLLHGSWRLASERGRVRGRVRWDR